jgi:hypothetical protein
MTGFESIQVRFKHTRHIPSPFANSREVPFVESYLTVLKSVVDDINTEYFWFFANFVDMNTVDIDYIPEQHEKDQLHVWYTTHPMGGLNKEGNVMLIPTEKFKEQMNDIEFLRDFKDINYHPNPDLYQQPIPRTSFKLRDPYYDYFKNNPGHIYQWMANKTLCYDLADYKFPDFFPSVWEDVKIYSWGKTKDIMLVPVGQNIKQFYDIKRSVNFELNYEVKPMDIVFLSYDEPSAEKHWKALKDKYPRAKRIQGVKGRTQAYHAAAAMSETDYFFAVFPTIELDDAFDFSFQPDRFKHSCHYIFHARNPVNGLEYGHRAVILYNKHLCLSTIHPSLDFTLSQPHTVVPQLCGTSHFNQTPEISWRVAFREVLKLCEMKPTVESQFRLKKWCELGQGQYADLVQRGALDAVEYYKQVNGDKEALQLSYELDWLKGKFNSIS